MLASCFWITLAATTDLSFFFVCHPLYMDVVLKKKIPIPRMNLDIFRIEFLSEQKEFVEVSNIFIFLTELLQYSIAQHQMSISNNILTRKLKLVLPPSYFKCSHPSNFKCRYGFSRLTLTVHLI